MDVAVEVYCPGFGGALCAPERSAGAAENMTVGFCDVDASRAFVVGSLFGLMHEDLGAIPLQGVKCLSRNVPQLMDRKVCRDQSFLPVHELLA